MQNIGTRGYERMESIMSRTQRRSGRIDKTRLRDMAPKFMEYYESAP